MGSAAERIAHDTFMPHMLVVVTMMIVIVIPFPRLGHDAA
jgi:hypothetical protein